MDRLLVATLNILNLADRWDERLPLLLADTAALRADLLALFDRDELQKYLTAEELPPAAGAGPIPPADAASSAGTTSPAAQ